MSAQKINFIVLILHTCSLDAMVCTKLDSNFVSDSHQGSCIISCKCSIVKSHESILKTIECEGDIHTVLPFLRKVVLTLCQLLLEKFIPLHKAIRSDLETSVLLLGMLGLVDRLENGWFRSPLFECSCEGLP